MSRRSPLRTALSNHRLRSPAVAERIVASTGLSPPALVYEAGAGDGVLTAALAPYAGRVVAVERERALWERLRQRFADDPRVEPVLADFRSIRLPRDEPYSVVGNLPFAITADVMRMLTETPNPLENAFLTMERDAAFRWGGFGRETLVSILAKPRFAFTIALALRRSDFVPGPRTDCVVLGMRRREHPLLGAREARAFEAFVRQGFTAGRRSVRRNLGRSAGYEAFRRAARDLDFDRDAAPGDLAFAQWLGLFRAITRDAPARQVGSRRR